MAWFVSINGKVGGPYDEATVIEGIRAGANPTALVCEVGSSDWREIASHRPFAEALRIGAPPPPAPAAAVAQPVRPERPPISGTNLRALVGVGIAVVGLVVAAGIVVVARSGTRAAEPEPAPAASAPPPPVQAPVHVEPTPAERARIAPTLPAALAVAKPHMDDQFGKVSTGTLLLGMWAAKHMTWKDVGVSQDEATYALTMKDPDEARGKRTCAGGSIIEIEKARLDDGRGYEGLLMSDGMRLFHFFAVGSSGTLVQNSPARLCGVVTGKYDYPNSAGGTGHAVQVVGMFDLPENRAAR
jgi:hypothetical protein